jgi:nitric oxide dioxygenase
LGQSLDIIIPEGLRARHWAGYSATMQSGSTRYGAGEILAVPAMRKDGRRISIEFRFSHSGTLAAECKGSRRSCAM